MKNTICNFIICLCLFMASSVAAHAQAGSLDSTFGTNGIVSTAIGIAQDWAKSITIQGDGKIVVTGYSSIGTSGDFGVVRYNSNGTLDTTFDFDGKVITDFGNLNDGSESVAIQSDGKIVVAGFCQISTNSDFGVVRYNSNGTLDSTFDFDGKVTTDFGNTSDWGYSVAIQSDGKIVVAGGTNNDFGVVRYESSGTLDTTFDFDGKVTTDFGNAFENGYSLAIQSDGKIVVAGTSIDINNGNNYSLVAVRYNINGTLDSTFDFDGRIKTDFGGVSDGGQSVTLQIDGKIVLAGHSSIAPLGYFGVVRYDATGTLDSTFDLDGKVTTDFGGYNTYSYSVAIQSDGKIVVAGINSIAGNSDFALVRYNSNGSIDSTFDFDGKVTKSVGSGNDEGYSVAIQIDGKILVAGAFDNGSNYDIAVVRFNGDLGSGIEENNSVKNTIKTYPNPFSNEIVITGIKEKGEITIFNLMGEEIMRMKTFNKETKINTENFLPGLYFLKYTNDSRNENVKLLKL